MKNDNVNKRLNYLSGKSDNHEAENDNLKNTLQEPLARSSSRAFYSKLLCEKFYEYKSETSFMGLPVVHICQGINPQTGKRSVAKGIIAIGDFSVGVFCFGVVSLGLCSIGYVSIGALGALGILSISGLFATGCVSIAGIAIGLMAFGYYALGLVAIGYYISGLYTYGNPPLHVIHWFQHIIRIKM